MSGFLEWWFEVSWPFFDWSDHTAIGIAIRESLWLFPVIEAIHLVGLAAIGGTILAVDLRLLRLVLPEQTAGELAQSLRPWFLGSLAMMLVTGFLLLLSEPLKLYYSNPFWFKMLGLFSGMLFAATLRRKIVRIDDARIGPIWGRLTGLFSIFLWGVVAWGGRWIGFS